MKILALTGGIGGAKLALGLAKVLDPQSVCFVVNTGDDFEHLGLHISPDLDTLCYTLAGLQNRHTGWGRDGETWSCLEELGKLGTATWFRLGDKDMATHLRRLELLRSGHTLTEATASIATSLGVDHPVFPMSDDPVRTIVSTSHEELTFQQYFVRDRCDPPVKGFRFTGAESAKPNPCIPFDSIDAVVICPSNPFVSVDPILSVSGMRDRLLDLNVPRVAVSPIVGGKAIKGPTAKMMTELGMTLSATTIVTHYGELLNGFVLDEQDRMLVNEVQDLGVKADVQRTVMVSLQDRVALAQSVLAFINTLA